MASGFKITYDVDTYVILSTCKNDKYPCIIYPSDGKIFIIYPRNEPSYLRIEIRDAKGHFIAFPHFYTDPWC